MEWQPIETAPKDGTKVDLWVITRGCYENKDERIPDASWEDGGWGTCETLQGTYGHWHFEYDGPAKKGHHCVKPTHWMPLPNPPSPICS